jgi:tetratricopeptide (TPR) repeat protein
MIEKKTVKILLQNDVTKSNPLKPEDLSELQKNPSQLVDTGYEFIENGKYLEAFKLFKLGALIDNRDIDILNGLGISLCEMGHLEESLKILILADETMPEDAITLANIAGVYWELNEYDMAIHYYTKSIEADSDLDESYYNLVNLYMEKGATYMAFLTCQELLQLNAGNEEAQDLMSEIILSLAISNY